jgi:DNA-binding response OmpR family regulator
MQVVPSGGRTGPEERLLAGDLEIRPAALVALARGRPLQLTRRELGLLVALSRQSGRVVRREELYEAVWGGELRKDDRSIDVHVRRLRRKLGTVLPEWRFIHTHFGLGYRFEAERSPNLHGDVTPM